MAELTRAKVVVVGAGGRLGAALVREYSDACEVVAFDRRQLDLADPEMMRRQLGPLEFDVLINCAAQTLVDRCETERAEAFAINAEAPRVLAEICRAQGARLLHISTDYVFDGRKRAPYTEEDEARPISVYGESKLAGEEAVLAVEANHLVARVSWVFGPDRPSFVDWIIGQAREKEQVAAVADKISAPTYTLDIAQMLRALWRDSESVDGPKAGRLAGLFHLANTGACTWQEYGQWALDCCVEEGLPLRARTVDAITLADMKNFIAQRPIYTVLDTEKFAGSTGLVPRPWQEAVQEYVRMHIARAY